MGRSNNLNINLKANTSQLASDVRRGFQGVENEAKKAAKAMEQSFGKATNSAIKGNNKLAKTVKNNNKTMSSSFSLLSKAILGVFSARAATGLISNIIQTGVEMDRLNKTLKASLSGFEEVAEAQRFLREESERLGLIYVDQIKGYSQLSAAAKSAGVELTDVKDIYLGIAEASTALQLSQDDAWAAMRAVVQIMSKGKVQAEELRGQLGERLPGAAQIAARALGVTDAQLNKLLEDGKLFSKDFLPLFGRALRKEWGGAAMDAAKSAQAAMNRFKNAWIDLKNEFARAGILDVFVATVKNLTEAFKGGQFKEGAIGFAESVGTIAKQLVIITGFVFKVIGAFDGLVARLATVAGAFLLIGIASRPIVFVLANILKGSIAFGLMAGMVRAVEAAFLILGGVAGVLSKKLMMISKWLLKMGGALFILAGRVTLSAKAFAYLHLWIGNAAVALGAFNNAMIVTYARALGVAVVIGVIVRELMWTTTVTKKMWIVFEDLFAKIWAGVKMVSRALLALVDLRKAMLNPIEDGKKIFEEMKQAYRDYLKEFEQIEIGTDLAFSEVVLEDLGFDPKKMAKDVSEKMRLLIDKINADIKDKEALDLGFQQRLSDFNDFVKKYQKIQAEHNAAMFGLRKQDEQAAIEAAKEEHRVRMELLRKGTNISEEEIKREIALTKEAMLAANKTNPNLYKPQAFVDLLQEQEDRLEILKNGHALIKAEATRHAEEITDIVIEAAKKRTAILFRLSQAKKTNIATLASLEKDAMHAGLMRIEIERAASIQAIQDVRYTHKEYYAQLEKQINDIAAAQKKELSAEGMRAYADAIFATSKAYEALKLNVEKVAVMEAQKGHEDRVRGYEQMLISKRQFDQLVLESEKLLQAELIEARKSAMEKWADEAKLAGEILEDVYQSTLSILSEGIGELVTNFKELSKEYDNNKEMFRAYASSFLRQIAKMIIQQTILNALQSQSGGFSGAGIIKGIASAIGGAFGGGSSVPYIPAAAEGGILSGPKSGYPAMLHGTEAVIPLNKMGSMGGVSTTINVAVNGGGGGGGSEEDRKRLGKDIAVVVKQAFNENLRQEMRPGGMLNRSA